MKDCKKTEAEDFEHSGRKKEMEKVILKVSGFSKDTMVAGSGEVEEDGTMSGNEEREEASEDGIAGKDKKSGGVMFDGEERKLEKRKKCKEKDDVLVGQEDEEKVKKRKKEKRGHMMLLGDKETKVKKKKKMEKDDVVVAGIEGKKVEGNKEMKREDMKAQNKEKKAKRKRKQTKDGVVAGHEEHNKLKDKKENKKEEVKVCPRSDNSKSISDNEGGLVQGKRFSEEENELIKKAISEYIEANQLGENGLDMVLQSKSHPHLKGCWQKIGAALPWRPYISVYYRARRLYRRGEGKWTPEEVEYVRKSYKKYGPKWKKMAEELGKNQAHVRNAFQRYQFGNLKNGKWSQHEYQTLFELVNKDLQMSVFEEKKSKHGMLRDNIHWEAISWKIGTRENSKCCRKWYDQLTSRMVAEGKWADVDDYRLLKVLVDLDASCEDEVDWDTLLEDRSGDLCRKRWLQMICHLGEHGNKSFSEQVEVLSKRYCPDLAEVREALDARPVVD